MSDVADDTLIAAHLAAAIIQAQPDRIGNTATGQSISPSRVAAWLYFDCFNALREERVERQKSQAQS